MEILLRLRYSASQTPDIDRSPLRAHGYGPTAEFQAAQIAHWQELLKSNDPSATAGDDPHMLSNPLSSLLGDLVNSHIPAKPKVDFEHFHEDCARLIAACKTGLPVRVLDLLGNERHRINTTEDYSGAPAIFIGFSGGKAHSSDPIRQRYNLAFDPFIQNEMANAYWGLDAFRKASGREFHVIDNPDTNLRNHPLYAKLVEMEAARHRRAFIKGTKLKSLICQVDLSGGPERVFDAMLNAVEYSFEHMPEKAGFLLQECLEMRNEYRFAVIDGKLVAGAGVVTEFSPLEARPGEKFSSLMRTHVYSNIQPIQSTDLLKKYIEFAETTIAEISQENPELLSYSLDVAETNIGSVAIELNGTLNLGRYAINYDLILAGLLEQAELALQAKPAVYAP